MPKSITNRNVFKTLQTAKKRRAHTGLIKKEYEELLTHKNTIARDINKCYTSIMYKPTERCFIFDFNDVWTECNIKQSTTKKIEDGLYYVETENTTLFIKKMIYTHQVL